jgi:hypothetical protein
MLRVHSSPAAAASANRPAAAGSAARASVRVAAPRSSCRAAAKGKEVLSGVVFQPFKELKGDLSLVPHKPDQSLARPPSTSRSSQCSAPFCHSFEWRIQFSHYSFGISGQPIIFLMIYLLLPQLCDMCPA